MSVDPPLRHRLVSVIGAGVTDDETYELARRTGRLLAAAGFTVVTGGLGGVMEAACRGAAEAGGLTVGILPGSSSATANPWVQLALATGLGDARNALVATAGVAAIAIGGEVGTLSEIALALKRGLPVITLRSWQLDRERLGAGRRLLEAETPERVIDLLLAEVS